MSCSRKQNAKYLGSNVKRKRTPPPFFQKEFTQTINTETEGEKKYKCGRQALTLILPSPFFHHPRVRPQETCLSVWGERGMLAHSSELYQLSAVEYENPLQDTHQSAASLPLMQTATVRRRVPSSQITSCLIFSKILLVLEIPCSYLQQDDDNSNLIGFFSN